MSTTQMQRLLPVLLLFAPAANAQDFNIDFQSPNSTHGVPSSSYGAAANRPGVWQKIEADSTSNLTAVDGGTTNVSLQILTQMGYFFDGDEGSTQGEEDALLDDTHQAYPDATYRFEGLTPGHYRVYTMGIDVHGNTFFWEFGGNESLQSASDISGIWGGIYHPIWNYAVHDFLVDDGVLEVVATAAISFFDNSQVAGIQIVRVDDPGAPYCFGSVPGPGGSSTCDCGNSWYGLGGCQNSTGSGARLYGSGSASYAADDLRLIGADLVPGQAALLYVGTNTPLDGNGATFGDGLRCASGAIVRLGIRVANSAGQAFFGPGLNAAGGWQPGATRYFQLWYRDPSGPCGSGFNLSNGYQILIEL